MSTIQIRNPRTGQYDYKIHPPTTAQLAGLANQMRHGQLAWEQAGVAGRVAAMQAWKDSFARHRDQVVAALSVDTGRRAESIMEADLLGPSIDRWCRIATELFGHPETRPSAVPFVQIEQGLVPYQLVGVISPWNFPLLLSIIDAIPALLAGCAVLVKPSEVTPRFLAPLQASIAEVPLLREVFSYVAGAGPTGADLVQHADLICFTGSTATGKKVYQAAAERFIPVFLELGGKDPAIVMASADVELATSSLLWGSVVNAGQSCLSIERIYVDQSIYHQFVDRLVAKAERLGLAYPDYGSGQIGPIISAPQAQIIAEHLRDAVDQGARILTGGHLTHEGGGDWCRPTVLVDVHPDMKVMREETFGPIMPVVPFAEVEEALALANGTIYGLSGAVFAGTNEEALQVARRLQGGAISINDSALTAIVHEGEKNSFKMSGLGGTRMGPAAIRRFMRQKAFLVKNQPIASPWWF